VLQADTLRYARVNTAIGEIDTVRAVSNPSRIVTSADGAYMFTDNDAKVERIDDAAPVDLDAEALLGDARAGRDGRHRRLRRRRGLPHRRGAVFAGRLSAGPAAPIEVPASAAVASSSSGVVFSYSARPAPSRGSTSPREGCRHRHRRGHRGAPRPHRGRRRLGAPGHRR
jgi:hypothetical protein